jgi:hypothetical protein
MFLFYCIRIFLFSGACKQLPGLSLSSGELSDDEFNLLRNYLMQSAYTAKEVFNVSSE